MDGTPSFANRNGRHRVDVDMNKQLTVGNFLKRVFLLFVQIGEVLRSVLRTRRLSKWA